MKRVGPGIRSANQRRRGAAIALVAIAFAISVAYLAYALLASLRMIVHPASDGGRPNLILMALAALVVGFGIALARRLAVVLVASRRRGPWSR